MMPRSAALEEKRALEAIERYLAPIIAGRDDGRSLSANGASKALRISRSTIRKYRLNERLRDVGKIRNAPKDTAKSALARMLDRAKAAERQRDLWKNMYEGVMEKYLKINEALRSRRDIDLDSILAAGLSKPDRGSPAKSGRRPSLNS